MEDLAEDLINRFLAQENIYNPEKNLVHYKNIQKKLELNKIF